MDFQIDVLDESEKIIFALRTLYHSKGYQRYRMSKFEEYDLYSRNKDFLVSDSVITFTDTNGRLMALKPDVTLSIIKNNKDRPKELNKLYYNENVYRVAKGSQSFREIMQAGLECIGAVDSQALSEVLMLAAMSLDTVSKEFVLEISDLTILSAFLEAVPVSSEVKKQLLKCVSEKNRHGIREICEAHEVESLYTDRLIRLMELYGHPDQVIDGLKELCGMTEDPQEGPAEAAEKDDKLSGTEPPLSQELQELLDVITVFRDSPYRDHIVIDFSLVSDMNYYNGVIFRGFIHGIPDSVLSGGQYDKLMRKLGRKSKAAGFAVYLDQLQEIMR